MPLAFGPGKSKPETFPGSKSGCASLRTRVCAQNGLTLASHLVGQLGPQRPGADN